MGGEDTKLTQGRGASERTGVLQKVATFHISAPLDTARRSRSDTLAARAAASGSGELAAAASAAAWMMLLASFGRLPCISVWFSCAIRAASLPVVRKAASD